MRNQLKLLLSTLLLVLILAFTACGGNGDGGQAAEDQPGLQNVENGGGGETPEAAPPERDLGGREINIATWWVEECTATVEPTSFSERARWDHRSEMEERYNFTMRYVRYGSWHDVRDDVQAQILAQNREFQFWVVEPIWFATNHGQGLFAPIPMHHFEDDYGIEWNESLLHLTMRDGNPHGFADGIEMAGGVYFNMRLLEEAGLERDLPFRLQSENNWTWDTFMDMARPLSRDLTGDGITDTWAITAFNQEVMNHALASNGAQYAVVDPDTGRFVNSTQTDAFREALEWVVQLYEEGLTFIEADGDAWDMFIQLFDDAQGAMRVAANYVAGNIELVDDWGFVAFPRGPRADRHYAWVTQNLNVIPHFYTQEDVDDFMFAMRAWIRPIEDDDPYDWIDEAIANHRDPRSVYETMVHFTRNPELQIVPSFQMMPGLGHTLAENFAWRVWRGNDASVIIDEAQLVWDAFLERVNNL
ncbi:MAG: extracellular solute-binding protein [Defluviitaleaceae bacterium]|nr:extracellular solute-binding protein [Defluviitaleaceae bacterium]